MPRPKVDTIKMQLYIPLAKRDRKIIQRLIAIADAQQRSVNFLVVEAVEQYLERAERHSTREKEGTD